MKKVLWATLATTLLLGGMSWTTHAAEEQTMSSDQAATVTNKEDATATEDSTLESTDTLSSSEEATKDSQAEAKEQTTDKEKDVKKEEDALTAKDVAKMNKDVVEEVAKQVNDGKKEKVTGDVLGNADSIRKVLLSDEYGITKKQLDTYTDAQLMNTATLFDRYNHDSSGMDLGAFVSLLNALYQDKTLNVDDCLAQLSFNPKSFGSFSALAEHIDALQVYLKTLYPSNSSFLPLKEVSNEDLATILQNLQAYQNKAQAAGEPLDAGPIAFIAYAINHPNSPGGVNSDIANNEETKSTDQDKAQATKTSDSSDKKEEAKKGGLFPQTGEKRGLTFGLLGVVIILAVGGFYFWNRSKKTKE